MSGVGKVSRHVVRRELDPTDRFDAVIVGGGAAGGLAAESLTRRGLKVLVLDAGRRSNIFEDPLRRIVQGSVKFVADPASLPFLPAWALYKGRMALRVLGRRRQPIQTGCYAWERMPEAFVDDIDCPYTTPPDREFSWFRARTLGGRLIIPGHGRQYLRFSPADFAPRDGASPPWPLSYSELAPWYEEVERRLGLFGSADDLPWLPDSVIATALTPTPREAILMAKIKDRWPRARPILGRYAPPPDTLEVAARSGMLTIREGAIARAIDVQAGVARGVHYIDNDTGADLYVAAPVIFLCASALESTRILLLSADSARGTMLGRASGVLGRNLMDHVMIKAEGLGPDVGRNTPDDLVEGRCVYLPRFEARDYSEPGDARGFGVQLYQTSIAASQSFFTGVSFSEMLPRPSNSVSIDTTRRDHWKIPVLHINCTYGAQELELARSQTQALEEIAAQLDIRLSRLDRSPPPPGNAVHECGTARMGSDPANSFLDAYNQCWEASGLYVTDSSSFPSQGSQNPTLTLMALTARACSHAAGDLKTSGSKRQNAEASIAGRSEWLEQRR